MTEVIPCKYCGKPPTSFQTQRSAFYNCIDQKCIFEVRKEKAAIEWNNRQKIVIEY